MRGFLDGAMCEYIVMNEKQLYHLPDEVSYDYGTFLDPLGNAIHLINRGGVKLGDVVAVSYTHLDVYKRQTVMRRLRKAFLSWRWKNQSRRKWER